MSRPRSSHQWREGDVPLTRILTARRLVTCENIGVESLEEQRDAPHKEEYSTQQPEVQTHHRTRADEEDSKMREGRVDQERTSSPESACPVLVGTMRD